MADDARSRLGRGLASLIGDVGGEAKHQDRPRTQRKVPIEFLKPNPRNPRRDFSDAELGELADSIRQHGVIQPIVVRPVKGSQDRRVGKAKRAHQHVSRLDDGGHGAESAFAHPTVYSGDAEILIPEHSS